MSCIIKRSSLSTDQRERVIKDLTLKGLPSRFGKSKSIKLFSYNQTTDDLTLPYVYAGNLIKDIPNKNVDHGKSLYKYTGILRDNQVPVAKLAIDHLKKYGTTTLSLRPGFGKTRIGLYLSQKLKLVTLVVVPPSLLLLDQWFVTAGECTTAKIWRVGDKPIEDPDIIICTNKSIHKIPNKYKIGTLIVDEAHLFCTQQQVATFFSFQPAFIIIETATLEREDDGLHTMIWNIAGKHEIARPFEDSFTIHFHTIHTKVQRREAETFAEVHKFLLEDYLMDPHVNSVIIDLVKANPDKKILILTKRVFHCEFLLKQLTDESVTGLFGDKKKYEDARILIGTTSKIGTGFDPASTCKGWDGRHFDFVICTTTFKKIGSMVQNYGRGFRSENPIVWQLVFDDRMFIDRTRAMKKWCVDHGGVVHTSSNKKK